MDDKKYKVPTVHLIYARALSAWAKSNDIGMTPAQFDIWLYIAGMLETNSECWISVSYLAKQLRQGRQSMVRTVKKSGKFFTHDEYKNGISDIKDRKWHLVQKVPTMKELVPFLPPKKDQKHAGSGKVVLNHYVSKGDAPLSQKETPPSASKGDTSVNTSPYGAVLGDMATRVYGGGGGCDHHQPQTPTTESNDIEAVDQKGQVEKTFQKKADPQPGSKEYPRHACQYILGLFQQFARMVFEKSAAEAGIVKGSDEWKVLLGRGGSPTYAPSDADIEYLLPLVKPCIANRSNRPSPYGFKHTAGLLIAPWMYQQIQIAIAAKSPVRDMLRMSAFSKYLAGFSEFQTEENQ